MNGQTVILLVALLALGALLPIWTPSKGTVTRLDSSAGQLPAKTTPAVAAPAWTGTVSDAMLDLIRRLPKAELHIHIEGTLEPELMWALAAENNVTLPYATIEEAKAARQGYANLQAFLDAYLVGSSVLVKEQDFHQLAAAYLDKAAAQNITHVELFFDPQSHIRRGVPLSTVVNGLQSAIDAAAAHPTHPISTTLILCLVRELGEVAAAAALVSALPYLPQITALGLASAELGHPPEEYRHVYAAAALLGLNKVAHAGEEAGPDFVWQALLVLQAQRIDHGIHALDDPQLVSYMVNHSTPITLCPISNQQLQVYGAALPDKLRAMLASGILVTINSDDPAYFAAYLNDNFAYVADVASLTPAQVASLAANSFEASFIPEERKAAARKQIEQVLAAWEADHQQQQAV